MASPSVFSGHAPAAYLVDPETAGTFDAFRPKIQFLTPSETPETAPCVMRAVFRPGVFVPLHSHDDLETFIIISGELEALVELAEGYRWVKVAPGCVLHAPGWAKHALRNLSGAPAAMICVTTAKLGRFVREISRLAGPEAPSAQPSPELMQRFHETVERYGYWLATPEENAEILA